MLVQVSSVDRIFERPVPGMETRIRRRMDEKRGFLFMIHLFVVSLDRGFAFILPNSHRQSKTTSPFLLTRSPTLPRLKGGTHEPETAYECRHSCRGAALQHPY
jgi:hypothetical protein